MNSAGKSNEHHRRMPVSPLATHRMMRVESQFQRLFKAIVGRTIRKARSCPIPGSADRWSMHACPDAEVRIIVPVLGCELRKSKDTSNLLI